MALFDVIRFDGLKSKDWLIYKYYSDEITSGSQLIVQEGQAAIYVSEGSITEVYRPGRYTLYTNNTPIVKDLLKIPFKKSPYSSEIYFVNTSYTLDVAWGTVDPIQLVDPLYKVKLRVRAFGKMGLSIYDPFLFFKHLIGGMQRAEVVKLNKVREFYRGLLVVKVKSAIANAIINDGISVLQIDAKLEELSNEVKGAIAKEFEQYGLYVTSFYIQSINFPDEDFERVNKILEDNAAFEIMGDGRYSKKRSFDVYEGAAANSTVTGAFIAGELGRTAAMTDITGGFSLDKDGKKSDDKKICSSCRKMIPKEYKFCPNCGCDTRERVCECGYKIISGNRFCPECGKTIDEI